MSEKRYKRFYVSESENQLTIYDNEGLDDYYHLGNDERDVKGICNLLNEQEATINKQLDQIIELQDKYRILEFNHSRLEKRNKAQYEKIDEQQTIIKSKDKQLERLYNYFQDYLKDEMSGNAFSEMWDFVKETESWEDE